MDETNKWYFIRFSDSKFSPRQGVEVTKLYIVFQLDQSHWITKYIKKNWQEE